MANAGDTLNIQLTYTINGEPITEGQFAEIEFCIGTQRYTLTDEDIVWDSDTGYYTIFIGQADSFDLSGNARFQVRFKDTDGEVVSSDEDTIRIGKSISRTVI